MSKYFDKSINNHPKYLKRKTWLYLSLLDKITSLYSEEQTYEKLLEFLNPNYIKDELYLNDIVWDCKISDIAKIEEFFGVKIININE